jgi:hypothetical protein
MLTITSHGDLTTNRPRVLKRYVAPPAPLMRKYTVEVLQGADDTISFPWWGPIDDYAPVVEELRELGYHPLSVLWE